MRSLLRHSLDTPYFFSAPHIKNVKTNKHVKTKNNERSTGGINRRINRNIIRRTKKTKKDK